MVTPRAVLSLAGSTPHVAGGIDLCLDAWPAAPRKARCQRQARRVLCADGAGGSGYDSYGPGVCAVRRRLD
eukprot:306724-Chlamydomonas_euryale.AAC.1